MPTSHPASIAVLDARVITMDPDRPYAEAVAIRDGRIAHVGSRGEVEALVDSTTEVIEAGGRVACPGFIDIHTHTDLDLFADPRHLLFKNYLMQGITTVLAGNCGMSEMEPGELLPRLDLHPPAVNFATLVGHGYVRNVCAIPAGLQELSVAQLDAMKSVIDRAMTDGAFGMSTGLEYIPGLSSRTVELIECAAVVAAHGGLYTSHMRSEGDELLAAVEEGIRIGRESGARVQLSHLKSDGACNWWKTDAVIGAIEAARADGIDVAGDQYPYPYFGWNPSIFIPGEHLAAGRETLIGTYLRDPEHRQRIKAAIVDRITRYHGGDGELVVVFDWTDRQERHWKGASLARILIERGLEASPEAVAELILEMLPDERGDAVMGTDLSTSDDAVRRYLSLPYLAVCTDGFNQAWLAPCHPRSYGAFPKVLGSYVREKQTLPLETALRKMTAVPAGILNLADRGVLRAGSWADVVVFDDRAVAERATFETPAAPDGIDFVLVNGVIAVDRRVPDGDGFCLGTAAGQGGPGLVLRRPR
ncbi:amidohydrolase family protein [Mycobacterium sp. 21AC1]|uniref:N-acyl-D-amino-acid deacylase family protein n=1 Tax=[Mycobacterium] appelbergii TaxID=2939269 RepID=UPI002938F648|nr:amidohydrolase family protein [Mycobacterium sp. 21AC1]MDV3129482.1 amidohydrolase family protein [Mycobacterium sp. 21AC1]